MKLTIEEVEHIAELAKLKLSDEEKEAYRSQLSAILEYADRLRELDTEDVPPAASVLPLSNVWRPDEVGESLPRQTALANAPASEAGQFRVDAVLE